MRDANDHSSTSVNLTRPLGQQTSEIGLAQPYGPVRPKPRKRA
jgi:hypothetical protein